MAMASKKNHDHNRKVLESLQPGDTIKIKRILYSHWAVFIGKENVIHLAGNDDDGVSDISGKLFTKASVKKQNFWDVVLDSKAYKNNDKDQEYKPGTIKEILDRAESKVGEVGYNILSRNCEHFASYCRYGEATSDQVKNIITGAVVVGVGVGVGVGVRLLIGDAADTTNSEEEDSTEGKVSVDLLSE